MTPLPTLPRMFGTATTSPRAPAGLGDKASWYAAHPQGSVMSGEELKSLLDSPYLINAGPSNPQIEDYGFGEDLIHYGGPDYAAWWDTTDPSHKGALELRFSPEREYKSTNDLYQALAGDRPVAIHPVAIGATGDTELAYGVYDDKGGFTPLSIPEEWKNVPVAGEGTPSGQYYRNTGNYVVSPEYSSNVADYFASLEKPDTFGQILSIAAPLALSFIPGFQALTPMAQGMIAGGLSSGLGGGNPILGTLAGGAGGLIGGYGASQGWNTTLTRALGSGVSGLIRSGGDTDAALNSAMTGGLTQLAGNYMPAWAASPLASAAVSTLRGRPVNNLSMLLSAAQAAAQDNVTAPRSALVKGVK